MEGVQDRWFVIPLRQTEFWVHQWREMWMHTNQQCTVQVQCLWTAAQLEKTWSKSSLSHPLLSLLLVAFSALAVRTLLYLCLLTETVSQHFLERHGKPSLRGYLFRLLQRSARSSSTRCHGCEWFQSAQVTVCQGWWPIPRS